MGPLDNFIALVCNVMEAYTTAIFTTIDGQQERMRLANWYSFSHHIDPNCQIAAGEGLIGWVMREQKSVVATPFERDTKTLRFYKENEAIKSFMAVPLPDSRGVFCVDSKKSYLFTEQKEKIFRQMAATAGDLLDREKIVKEHNVLQRLLTASLHIDDLITGTRGNRETVAEILRILALTFRLSHLFFFRPEVDITTLRYVEDRDGYFISRQPGHTLSPRSLMALAVKNRKMLVKDHIAPGDSVAIVQEDEDRSLMANFLAIPFYDRNTGQYGCCGAVKMDQRGWLRAELQAMDRFIKRMTFGGA